VLLFGWLIRRIQGVAHPVVQEETEEKPAGKVSPQYEFGGPILTTLLTLLLPTSLILLHDICTKDLCDIRTLPALSTDVNDYFSVQAAAGYVGFVLLQALLAVIPVGKLINGRPLKSGKSLKYNCNGLFALAVTAAVFSGLEQKGIFPVVQELLQNMRHVLCTAIAGSFLLSIILYIASRKIAPSMRSQNGNTGNFLYDLFMGRALNPRVGSLDLKFFLSRVGVLGLGVISWMVGVSAWQQNTLSPALILLLVAQNLYVADAMFFEDTRLSSLDITTEGLGFNLALMDLAWVPFMYCYQTHYMFVTNQLQACNWALVLITLLNVLGYLIYRGSTSQKDNFRRLPHSPSVAHLDTVPTATGKNLLISGWWGLCQKPNYLGHLLMMTAWALYAGFGSVIPYINVICMLLLLVHRQRRDSTYCQRKHGAAWTRYCQHVRYRIIPYVY